MTQSPSTAESLHCGDAELNYVLLPETKTAVHVGEAMAHQSSLHDVPDSVQGPLTWTGLDFALPTYILHLKHHEVAEIETALQAFKTFGLDGDEVTPATFPLPTVQERLCRVAVDLHCGKGFALLRGFDMKRYSAEDALIIYLGVSSYIGDMVGLQDRKGNALTHITDSAEWKVPYDQRHGIHTNTGMPFHSDMGTDILALQFRESARKRGATYVASSWFIYNELARDNPDALGALMSPTWPIQISGRPPSYVLAPILQYHDGKVMTSLDPGRLGVRPTASVCRSEEPVPSLTATQLEALKIVAELANQHRLDIVGQPGDILFINNWALLHARDSYEDGGEPNCRRHLVRLWLRNSKLGWSIPQSMSVPWRAAFGYYKEEDHVAHGESRTMSRLGRSVERKYPVVPVTEYRPPKYTSGSAAFLLEDAEGEVVG